LNRTTQRDVKLSNSSIISHEAYGYDPLRPGLLTSVTRLEQGQSQKQDTFAYDLMGALKTAQYDIPSGGSALRTCGYVWDRAGNRSSMSDSAGPSCSYQTTCLNQYSLVGGEVVGSGNWHELGSYQNIAYTYVNDTRLASVSGISHTYRVFYDALGRCVVRTMDGSTSCYVYDGEKPIVEYGGSFVKTATIIYGRGIDEILQRTDYTASPARTFYYQDDHEGNITHLMMQINNTPTVVETYRYDAFGKPTITNTSGIVTNNRFMFTGREYVSQFGIYEYRNRAYHPGLGRFMSEDPKLFVHRAGLGKAPDDWLFAKHVDEAEYNLFRYCGNDPLDFTDPMGLEFNGDLDAKQVETIQGNRLGMTGVQVDVVPVELKDGKYTLRLDVNVVKREVAQKVKWHGREVKRTDEQMKVTAEEHEKTEHNKDWKGFHDAHQSDVSNTRFSSKEAAEAAAKEATRQEEDAARKAKFEFEKHEPNERWNPIIIREQPKLLCCLLACYYSLGV
jgi:RHS repeat-associated protein